MNDLILSADAVSKYYDEGGKKVSAVSGVSLGIRRGESVAIVGPSGAGKSTLLHMLGALDRPTSGKVFLDGADIYSMTDSSRARMRSQKIGFVFQFYHLLPEFTALENVLMPAMIAGRKSIERAKRLLESVGLAGRMNHRPGELSGGESQRVAIARAMVNEPVILLCDEPTGNLDSKNREAIYGLLSEIRSGSGISTVIVTHDESVSASSDNTVRLKDGKLATS